LSHLDELQRSVRDGGAGRSGISVREAVRAAGRSARRDRRGALATLAEVFAEGRLPSPPLEGRYRGELITPTLNPWLDDFGRAFTRWWLPWKGKTFSRAANTGDNIFSNDGRWLARLMWPAYRRYVPDGPSQTRALQFRTYAAPGQIDPSVVVFKIDYDWDVNPRFIVRGVLDELVQIDDDYLLGQALLRQKTGAYVRAVYFALSPA
jgi:hypothetical protein